jgi:hypothetical protein
MTFKPKSEFRSLEISLVLMIGGLYGGGALRWWPYPAERELLFLVLGWIFLTLVEIGKALERISPPEQESDEYMGP